MGMFVGQRKRERRERISEGERKRKKRICGLCKCPLEAAFGMRLESCACLGNLLYRPLLDNGGRVMRARRRTRSKWGRGGIGKTALYLKDNPGVQDEH